MKEFRDLRPDWMFVGECDNPAFQEEEGFTLDSMHKWNGNQMDAHFGKFFTELFGMAISKFWIGIKYSNVSWFVFLMRRANPHGMRFLKVEGEPENFTLAE